MKKIIVLLLGLFLLTGCGSKKDTVIIYSCMEENTTQALNQKIKEDLKVVDVVIQNISTGNLAAKIKTEGKNIEADIVLDLETSHAENLKDNFADISSFDTSVYADGIENSDKYLLWTKYSIGLIVDNKYLKEHKLDVPKTYEDLLNKKYKGLIAMPDPKTSGTGYAFFLNTVNEMGEDNAIEYFKKLRNNVREFTASGSGPSNLLKQGEIAIAMGMVSQGVTAINEGYDFSIVELKTGMPYNTTSFAIINGKEDNENVKKVYQYLIEKGVKFNSENFFPEGITKDEKSNFENYPAIKKVANMKGYDDVKVKDELTKVWEKVNG